MPLFVFTPPLADEWALMIRTLLDWYDRHGRSLPWRERPTDPYRVWISEIMLQQTRVETVIPYYQRFLQRFPNLSVLARASLEEVLRLWEGLGYYARARHLHRCAQQLRQAGYAQLPAAYDTLRQLPGIGPYTAAAIASISAGEPRPAIDGNLYRLFSRLLVGPRAAGLSPSPTRTRHALERLLTPIWPRQRPGDLNQAAMDLAATICLPRLPRCPICPLARWCRLLNPGLTSAAVAPDQPAGVATAPIGPAVNIAPAPAPALPRLTLAVLIVVRSGLTPRVLCRQRQAEGLFGGLWEFPTVPYYPGSPFPKRLPKSTGWRWQSLPVRQQRLTHRLLELHPFLIIGPSRPSALAPCQAPTPGNHRPAQIWATLAELAELPLPRAWRQLAQALPTWLAEATQPLPPCATGPAPHDPEWPHAAAT